MPGHSKIDRLRRRRSCVALGTLHVAALLLACLGLFFPQVRAQQPKPSEYKVKAIYLYNFGKFVQWPGDRDAQGPSGSFLICVLGKDPFGGLLESTIKGEEINEMHLVAKRVTSPADTAGCRILFISLSEEQRLANILEDLQSKPILTVSDIPNFCDRGGMIQFELKEGKIRFAVNLTAAEKPGLALSSQLVKVATSVRRNP